MRTSLILLLSIWSCLAQLPVVPLQRYVTPAAGTNTPPFNNNLVFWYEATDAVTNTNGVAAANGDIIHIWGDRWTNHYDLTNAIMNGTQLPSYHTNAGPNSQPWVGTGDVGAGSSGLSNKFSTTYAQTNTYYFVADCENVTAGVVFDGIGARNYYGANKQMFAGSLATVNFNQEGAGRFFIHTLQFSGTASRFRINGTNFVTGLSVGAQGLQSFVVGNRNDMGAPSSNAFCEILMYNHADTTNDMHVVEDYLSVKYGIPVADQ